MYSSLRPESKKLEQYACLLIIICAVDLIICHNAVPINKTADKNIYKNGKSEQ
jgi:hypothetical protein